MTVCGGSGVGKSEIASLLAHMLNEKGKVVTFCPVITTHTAYLVKMIRREKKCMKKEDMRHL